MITAKDVEHVAKLARLALSEDEKKLYTKQLGKIIEYFSELEKVDTDGVEPMSHPLTISNVMRNDEEVASPGHETMLRTAPESEGQFFKVPRIGE